ncbi:MAG: hypothetical protein DRJ69_03770 [Thermoprotei archaeon]|nr:MAG: hypothetical protein DRJ69_03770 [Thermoprotei archaeon]
MNPFVKWWGYGNVAWMHREEEPIRFTSTFDYAGLREVVEGLARESWLRKGFGELLDPLDEAVVEYGLEVSGAGGHVPLKESVSLKSQGFKAVFEEGGG